MLLQDGRTVYDGPVREVKDYFGRCGFAAPPDENPMDYYFDVLQEQPGNGSDMSGRDAAELVEAGVKGVLTATASPESTAAIAPSPLAKGEEGGGGEGGGGGGGERCGGGAECRWRAPARSPNAAVGRPTSS